MNEHRNSPVVALVMTPELNARLDRAAAKLFMKRSAIVRAALDAWLAKKGL